MGYQTGFTLLLGLVALYGLIGGGRPEKLMAIAFVTAALWTAALHRPGLHSYVHLDLAVLVIDSALLTAIALIALYYDRFWPIWMFGFHSMAVAAHLAKLLNDQLMPFAYQHSLVFWSYPAVLLLVPATVRHRRRVRLYWHGCSSSQAWRMRPPAPPA